MIDDLFNMLWTNNQWIYDGDIPPEYLFPETLDIPDTDVVNNTHSSNQQLATDLLDDHNTNTTSMVNHHHQLQPNLTIKHKIAAMAYQTSTVPLILM